MQGKEKTGRRNKMNPNAVELGAFLGLLMLICAIGMAVCILLFIWAFIKVNFIDKKKTTGVRYQCAVCKKKFEPKKWKNGYCPSCGCGTWFFPIEET